MEVAAADAARRGRGVTAGGGGVTAEAALPRGDGRAFGDAAVCLTRLAAGGEGADGEEGAARLAG